MGNRVFVYICILGAAIGFAVSQFVDNRYSGLCQRGVRTTGVVTEMQLSNHNRVRCRYVVDGKAYTILDNVELPNPDAADLYPGAPVTLYYDRTAPISAVIGDPKPAYDNEAGSIAMAGIFIPVFIMIAFRSWISGLGSLDAEREQSFRWSFKKRKG
ncbi:MAG TPA: DUF3592 domain-containing protein [Capsulimonadaceae bacterium]|jgi:hypothetical protein